MTTLSNVEINNLCPKRRFFQVPESICHIGYEKALVLTRIQYWIKVSGHEVEGEEGLWIYNSIKKWQEQFSFFSQYKIKKIIASLEKDGLLISKKVNAKKCNHTKWYTIDLNRLSSIVKPIEPGSKKNFSTLTNRLVENQPTYNSNRQRTSYTKRSSSIGIEETERIEKEEVVFDIKKVEKGKSRELTSIRNVTVSSPSSKASTVEGEQEAKVAEQMVDAWNEEFRYSLSPIRGYSNAKTIRQLYDIYVEIFESDMEKWKQYAQIVNSSKFLMGEKMTKKGFKALFSWLIRKEVVEEILGGGYGVGDREVDRYRVSENIEQEKKEIIGKAVEQLSEMTRSKSGDEEEFKKYVLEDGFDEDGDKYGIRSYIRGTWYLSSERLIYDDRNKWLYDMLYERYVLKKQIGKNVPELSKELEGKLDAGIKRRGINLEVLEGLKKLKRSIMEGSIQELEQNIHLLLSEQTREC